MSYIILLYEDVSDNPLGNYKTLIRKMATQPAMMYYLNNQANSKPLTRILLESYGTFHFRKRPIKPIY
jgi:hypothetical protein